MEVRLIMCYLPHHPPTHQLLCCSPCGAEISCGEGRQHCSFSPLKGAASVAEQPGILPSAQASLRQHTHQHLHKWRQIVAKVTTSSLNTAAAGERPGQSKQMEHLLFFYCHKGEIAALIVQVSFLNTLYPFYLKFIIHCFEKRRLFCFQKLYLLCKPRIR